MTGSLNSLEHTMYGDAEIIFSTCKVYVPAIDAVSVGLSPAEAIPTPFRYHLFVPVCADEINSTLPSEQNDNALAAVILGFAGVSFTTTCAAKLGLELHGSETISTV